jgi:DNA-binding XRE family transcriptional regulator
MNEAMRASSPAASQTESFRDLLVRYRARSGLTQRQLAERLGIHRRSVQEWEVGGNYPNRQRLEAVIQTLLEAGGLDSGQEAAEAQMVWAAVERAAPRTHCNFDASWFSRLLAERAVLTPAPECSHASRQTDTLPSGQPRRTADRREDWGDAPEVSGFVNRAHELALLRGWVLEERCRLLALLGMGGIGKTSLAAKLAREVAPSFDCVYWRSLQDVLPAREWLAGAIGFLSDQQLLAPATEAEQMRVLLQLLRERRCLLVLDNFETLLEPGACDGRYRAGMAEYGHLVDALAQAAHQSCVFLTSREAPAELTAIVGGAARTLRLGGLGVEAVQLVLASKELLGSSEQWSELTVQMGGNPWALKMVGDSIRELFGGDIAAFLHEAPVGCLFGRMRRLIAEQVERSSVSEQSLLRVLAVHREPLPMAELLGALGPRIGRNAVLEAIQVLGRRSLIERVATHGGSAFTLQSLVLQYVTEELVDSHPPHAGGL